MRTIAIGLTVAWALVIGGYLWRRRQQRQTDQQCSDSWRHEHGYDKSGDRL
jgi:hypothetical protein